MRDHFARSFHIFEWARKKLRAGKSIAPTAAQYLHRNSDKMVNSLTSVSRTVLPLNQLETNAFSHNLVLIQ